MVSPIKMREVIGDGGITSRSLSMKFRRDGPLGPFGPAKSCTSWERLFYHLGKWSYFTTLNLDKLRPFWDDSPTINHDKPGFGRTGFGRDEIYPVPSFRIRRLRAAIWDTSCGEKPPTLRGAEFIGRCRLCGRTSGKSSKTHRKPYEPWLL